MGSRGSGILGRETSNILHRMAVVKFIETVNLNLMEVRDRVIWVRAFQAKYTAKTRP